jgi:hypothetical protein
MKRVNGNTASYNRPGTEGVHKRTVSHCTVYRMQAPSQDVPSTLTPQPYPTHQAYCPKNGAGQHSDSALTLLSASEKSLMVMGGIEAMVTALMSVTPHRPWRTGPMAASLHTAATSAPEKPGTPSTPKCGGKGGGEA